MFTFLLFTRVSNNEKKLEAVRSGVRAISVSGKIRHGQIKMNTQSDCFRGSSCCLSLWLSISNICFFSHSLFSSLGTASPSHPVHSVPCFLLFTSSSPPLYLHPFIVCFFFFTLWSSFLPDWLRKAHEDEDQLTDGTRESEVNTSFILILWMDGYRLQAGVQIKNRSVETRS